MRLARVGIDRVVGVLEDGVAGWAGADLPLAMTEQITVGLERAAVGTGGGRRAPAGGVGRRSHCGSGAAAGGQIEERDEGSGPRPCDGGALEERVSKRDRMQPAGEGGVRAADQRGGRV